MRNFRLGSGSPEYCVLRLWTLFRVISLMGLCILVFFPTCMLMFDFQRSQIVVLYIMSGCNSCFQRERKVVMYVLHFILLESNQWTWISKACIDKTKENPVAHLSLVKGKNLCHITNVSQYSKHCLSSVHFSSVTQSCLTLCDPMNCSTPGLPFHHQLLEFTQTQVHRVGDAIQPSHPLSSPTPPALNPFLASESFPMSKLFAWGGQSIGISASASVLPVNIQKYFL